MNYVSSCRRLTPRQSLSFRFTVPLGRGAVYPISCPNMKDSPGPTGGRIPQDWLTQTANSRRNP